MRRLLNFWRLRTEPFTLITADGEPHDYEYEYYRTLNGIAVITRVRPRGTSGKGQMT